MVTAGDLGTDPEYLEKKLSKIFDYAVSWNAILLLDEADIFLQDRDYDNLQRNALVSSECKISPHNFPIIQCQDY